MEFGCPACKAAETGKMFQSVLDDELEAEPVLEGDLSRFHFWLAATFMMFFITIFATSVALVFNAVGFINLVPPTLVICVGGLVGCFANLLSSRPKSAANTQENDSV